MNRSNKIKAQNNNFNLIGKLILLTLMFLFSEISFSQSRVEKYTIGKIEVSGKKTSQKLYRRHSGRPGGMKIEKFESLIERIPERIIEQAVKGMLPHNSLGRQQFKKLKVYKGADHPHAAQNPVLLNS